MTVRYALYVWSSGRGNTILSIQLAFFVAAAVHALGDGILAGVLDNGKVANGLRHSFIMLIIGLLVFQLV